MRMKLVTAAFACTLLASAMVVAQQAPQPSEEAEGGAGGARGAGGTPESQIDRTMQEMMDLRPQAPVVEPQRPGGGAIEQAPGRVGLPAARVDVDRSVLGVAPGQAQPHLRREGEFVVNRLGRVVRSPDGAHVLFAFEADSPEAPEPPMILQPCRNLEAMENIVSDRGDAVKFVVSGQVHVYRGTNYLLPTMYQLHRDRGNLEN